MTERRGVLVCGRGGHAAVVAATLVRAGHDLAGYVLRDRAAAAGDVAVEIFEDDLSLDRHGHLRLANGVGGVAPGGPRRRLFEALKARGFQFETIVDPSAVLVGEVQLAEGAQVLAGAVLHPGVAVGANALVNTRAAIDHGCRIGAHAHVAPGCTLSGDVTVGEGAHIGTGAVVIQGIRIGDGALVAAGAVVIRDVPAGGRVAGVPARPMA